MLSLAINLTFIIGNRGNGKGFDMDMKLVVVGWFGIIQVMTYHWIVGAGMLTLGLTSQML